MSNNNKKVVSMPKNTGAVKMELPHGQKMPNEMSEQERQAFMNEPVTRAEVSNFVDGYINGQVIPQIMNAVGKELFHLRSMNTVLQTFIINAGICTEDELVKAYEDFIKEQTKKMEEAQREQNLKAKGVILPDKKIVH